MVFAKNRRHIKNYVILLNLISSGKKIYYKTVKFMHFHKIKQAEVVEMDWESWHSYPKLAEFWSWIITKFELGRPGCENQSYDHQFCNVLSGFQLS